ncbi:DM13 domain-containing protein [soil metagenome]
MKYIVIITLLLITAACKKEAATTRLDEMVMDTAAAKTFSGSFENGPYGTTMGMAQIFQLPDGKLQLQLSAFNVNNGPDLKVYLSKEIMPVNFINLGDLKSTNGNQVYDIEGNVDLKVYKYACIHCKSYNHLFGYALLK